MRIRSDIFVSALTRRVFSDGGYAAIAAKGSEASGAIFVRQRFRDGLETLYGPAPQALIGEGDRDDRVFEPRLLRVEPEAVEALIARERKFDSDLWLVEIEVDDLGTYLPLTDQKAETAPTLPVMGRVGAKLRGGVTQAAAECTCRQKAETATAYCLLPKT